MPHLQDLRHLRAGSGAGWLLYTELRKRPALRRDPVRMADVAVSVYTFGSDVDIEGGPHATR